MNRNLPLGYDDSYLVVGPYDQEAMKEIVKRAYGGTHGGYCPFIEKCSKEAGYSTAVLHKATDKMGKKRISPLPLSIVEAVVRNSDGRVTMEETLAANGIVRRELVDTLIDTLCPPKQEVQDLRYRKWRDKVESDTDPSGFAAFSANLKAFCGELDAADSENVLKNKDKLFSSAFFAWTLQQYELSCKEDGKDAKAAEIKQVLMDLAVKCSRWTEWHFMENDIKLA